MSAAVFRKILSFNLSKGYFSKKASLQATRENDNMSSR
jgi:hypothetical protein